VCGVGVDFVLVLDDNDEVVIFVVFIVEVLVIVLNVVVCVVVVDGVGVETVVVGSNEGH
jgi:hypothetical protein